MPASFEIFPENFPESREFWLETGSVVTASRTSHPWFYRLFGFETNSERSVAAVPGARFTPSIILYLDPPGMVAGPLAKGVLRSRARILQSREQSSPVPPAHLLSKAPVAESP